MSIHLTIKNENHDAREKNAVFSMVVVAGAPICFLVENKGLSWGEKLSEKGSVKQTKHECSY